MAKKIFYGCFTDKPDGGFSFSVSPDVTDDVLYSIEWPAAVYITNNNAYLIGIESDADYTALQEQVKGSIEFIESPDEVAEYFRCMCSVSDTDELSQSEFCVLAASVISQKIEEYFRLIQNQSRRLIEDLNLMKKSQQTIMNAIDIMNRHKGVLNMEKDCHIGDDETDDFFGDDDCEEMTLEELFGEDISDDFFSDDDCEEMTLEELFSESDSADLFCDSFGNISSGDCADFDSETPFMIDILKKNVRKIISMSERIMGDAYSIADDAETIRTQAEKLQKMNFDFYCDVEIV